MVSIVSNVFGEQHFQVMVLHLWRICSWLRCSETPKILVTRICRICVEWEYNRWGYVFVKDVLHIDKYVTCLSMKVYIYVKYSVQGPPSPYMLRYNSCSQSRWEGTLVCMRLLSYRGIGHHKEEQYHLNTIFSSLQMPKKFKCDFSNHMPKRCPISGFPWTSGSRFFF